MDFWFFFLSHSRAENFPHKHATLFFLALIKNHWCIAFFFFNISVRVEAIRILSHIRLSPISWGATFIANQTNFPSFCHSSNKRQTLSVCMHLRCEWVKMRAGGGLSLNEHWLTLALFLIIECVFWPLSWLPSILLCACMCVSSR